MALLTLARALRACCFGLALFAGALPSAQAYANAQVERHLKAAYLYRFASYVEWPQDAFARPDSPFVIGVAGSEAVAAQLNRIVSGRTVDGHPVQVRRVRGNADLDGLHMLYATGDRYAVAQLLAHARGLALLTVTDSDQAFAQGGMINFVIAENRLRFEVALRRVNTNGLRISARMLAAAHKVDTLIPI